MATKEDMVPAAEVEAIVAKRVAEVESRLAEMIMNMAKGAADKPGPSMLSPDALAMSLAQLVDQGTGRKRVAPEVLQKRDEARVRMFDLIAEANEKRTEPAYRLRHMTFLGNSRQNPIWIDERHRQQSTEIGWYGVPNEAMEPLNAVAEAIYAAFAESIGAIAKRDMGPMRVTASGLAIIKGPPTNDEAVHVMAPDAGGRGSLAPTIRGRGAPGPTVESHILGSIMPPARQVA
jgi:hypothetical protein